MKRFATFLLALVMILSLAIPAAAQTVGTAVEGTGSITITNAAKSETYTIYKLFGATVAGNAIAYTGTIPESLNAYFEADAAGNISETTAARDGEKMSAGLEAALKAWAKTATKTADAVSDGSELVFAGLEYGYYVVTTSQGEQAITVTSTKPNATIVDKNSTVPKALVKTVDDADVFIGQTVKYTVTFETANYDGAGEDAKQITRYIISDTLPDFLENVTVTGITIDSVDYKVNDAVPQFDANKQIIIPWANDGTSLYKNGAKVEVTYTAVVSDKAAIAGNGNTNEVTVDFDGNAPLKDTETIKTYAIALKKVDPKGNALAGATFQFPFYVKETADTDGAYIYAGTEAATGLTNTITTPDSGEIVVKGVATGSYSITETVAPAGYNKLTAPVVVEAVETSETSTTVTKYLDENGVEVATETTTKVEYKNEKLAAAVVVVVNKAGTELPSTGGAGTTMFYIFGGILVLAAVVLLVTKKRMAVAE